MTFRKTTLAASWLRMEIDLAVAMGAERDAVLSAMRLTDADLARDDAPISLEHDIAFWESIADVSGDDAWGTHAGEVAARFQVELGGEVSEWLRYAMLSSATLSEALERLARYSRLLHAEFLDLQVHRVRTDFSVEARALVPPNCDASQFHEFFLSYYVHTGRGFFGETIPPKEVRFTHPCRGDAALRERVFEAPVRFGADVNACVWDAAHLTMPSKARDDRLCKLIDGLLGNAMARSPGATDFIGRAKRAVVQDLSNGCPRIGQVAKRLGVSPRTFQRHLGDLGMTFRDLVDGARRDLAVELAKQQGMGDCELAFALGFSHQSAFSRAKRRWKVDS